MGRRGRGGEGGRRKRREDKNENTEIKIGISTDGEHSLRQLHPKPTSGHIHVEESLEAAVDS